MLADDGLHIEEASNGDNVFSEALLACSEGCKSIAATLGGSVAEAPPDEYPAEMTLVRTCNLLSATSSAPDTPVIGEALRVEVSH